MHAPLASLPMYLGNPTATEQLWNLLQIALQERGIDFPGDLTWPEDYHAHWKNPKLLLSQTCGYPFTNELASFVQLVGVFHYDTPYCSGFRCHSLIVVRDNEPHHNLAAFKNRVAAYNSADSQSGCNSFRDSVAPLSTNGSFFHHTIATDAHSQSLALVRSGGADIACIDCVTYAGIERYTPERLQGLRIIGTTDSYPGLPLISAINTPAATVQALRESLAHIVKQPGNKAVLQAQFIVGFEVPDPAVYQRCIDMDQAAIALGYPLLA